MPNISERLLFWDEKLATRDFFTPFELVRSFKAKFKEDISERTFKEDLKKLKKEHHAPFQNKRFDNRNDTLKANQKSHYFYSEHFTISPKVMQLTVEDADRIQQAVDVLKQFKHLPHLKDLEKVLFKLRHEAHINPTERLPKEEEIIAFEQVSQLRGFERLESLYQAIKDKKAQKLRYKPFGERTNAPLLFHPYFLKESNNRWFVYGFNQDTNEVLPYALDRIEGLLDNTFPYRPNE